MRFTPFITPTKSKIECFLFDYSQV